MIESTTQAPEKSGELTGIYDTPYALDNGCLSIERTTKSGVYYTRLCNFAPKIVSEVTVDDGAELTRKYLIGGTDDKGRELPLVEVAATELEKMEWMLNHWDLGYEMVDHRDDVLVGHSLSARIRDHLSADELRLYQG